MTAVRRFPLGTPFGLACLLCLALAGWALWTGGAFESEVARQVRTSSVYAAPGSGLDVAAAERILGNRRLVVILRGSGADLAAGCRDVERAAAGTIVLLLRPEPDGGGFDTYGCSHLPGGDERFGETLVAETTLGGGLDGFVDRPLDAMKVIAVNYDRLAAAGMVPADARTISPSLPRYVLAGTALLAVVAGAAVVYGAARRAGRRAAVRREDLERTGDSRSVLNAATAEVARQIVELDGVLPVRGKRRLAGRYRAVAVQYVRLLEDIAAADRNGDVDFTPYTERAEAMGARLRELTGQVRS